MAESGDRAKFVRRIRNRATRLAAFLAFSFLTGRAQTAGQPQLPPPGISNHPLTDIAPDEPPPRFTETMRAKRNEDRQKRLAGDAQRLLQLANQLKSEVAVSGAETMTPEMLRQIDEIEHLARSVKDKMRN